MKKIKVRDLTLRDGQQSQFATRMTQNQINRVLNDYAKTNFYAAEVWGGAVLDSTMRYLDENPWDRLEKISSNIGDNIKITALSRGRNLFGYSPYPNEVIDGFFDIAVDTGLDIMRIFDALNDVNNIKSSIKYVKKYGGVADCAICYTVDPKFTTKQKISAFFNGKKLPKNLFNSEYYVNKAKEMVDAGADIITIKDMAGLIHPEFADRLIPKLKKEIDVDINLHSHSTPGYGLATALVAMIHDVDIIDTVLMPFAGGPAPPAYELIQIFADKLGIKTDVNREVISDINEELFDIREELQEYDTTKKFPIKFDIDSYNLDKNIDKLFDKAIKLAKSKNFDELLETTQSIEQYFNFPKPNKNVKEAEIPGGMYTNMVAQLKQAKLDDHIDEVLKFVPLVRVDAGCPPLVTPTSQIVGSQAVYSLLNKQKGRPLYANTTVQFRDLILGQYGKTPFPIDPDFREKICGTRKEIPYNTDNYKKQRNPKLKKYGHIRLAKNEKEELLLELFPNVAKNFLEKKREKEYREHLSKLYPEPKDIQPKELDEKAKEKLYQEVW